MSQFDERKSETVEKQVKQLEQIAVKLVRDCQNPASYGDNPPAPEQMTPPSEAIAAVSIWARGLVMDGKIPRESVDEFDRRMERYIRPNPPVPRFEVHSKSQKSSGGILSRLWPF